MSQNADTRGGISEKNADVGKWRCWKIIKDNRMIEIIILNPRLIPLQKHQMSQKIILMLIYLLGECLMFMYGEYLIY